MAQSAAPVFAFVLFLVLALAHGSSGRFWSSVSVRDTQARGCVGVGVLYLLGWQTKL